MRRVPTLMPPPAYGLSAVYVPPERFAHVTRSEAVDTPTDSRDSHPRPPATHSNCGSMTSPLCRLANDWMTPRSRHQEPDCELE